MLFAGPLAGMIGRRFGSKWPLAGGMLIVSCAALLFAVAHDEPWPVLSRARCSVSASAGLRRDGGADRGQRRSARDGRRERHEHRRPRDRRGHRRARSARPLLTAQTIGDSTIPAESAFTTTFAPQHGDGARRCGRLGLDRHPSAPPAAAERPRCARSHPLGGRRDHPCGQAISALGPMRTGPSGTQDLRIDLEVLEMTQMTNAATRSEPAGLDVSPLRRLLDGDVVTAGDDGWDEARARLEPDRRPAACGRRAARVRRGCRRGRRVREGPGPAGGAAGNGARRSRARRVVRHDPAQDRADAERHDRPGRRRRHAPKPA